ncbi:MAG: response regulator [Burkholderiales bacterium]|nr:response regulator [Burkholderiales bacterium]MDE2454231.1 response regulator [Burkholderiales bacterium]
MQLEHAQGEWPFHALADTLPDFIVRYDRDGKRTYFNAAVQRLLEGLGRTRPPGPSAVPSFFSQPTRERYRQALAKVLADGVLQEFEGTLCDAEGHTLVHNIRFVAERDADGGIVGALTVGRDITELRCAVDELERHRQQLEETVALRTRDLAVALDAAEAANRAKSSFLANMSHELRTPMNAIMGLTSLALSRATDPKQADQLAKAGNAAEHLLSIISDILDLSQIEAEQLILRPRDFSMKTVFERASQSVCETAATKGLEIVLSIDQSVPAALFGDDGRLLQILVNFLGNAVKFSERGRIEVTARCESDDLRGLLLRIEVRDQGIGISPQIQSKLFRPFVQGDDSLTRAHGGTGLGLTICRRIARLMGGDVGVSSELGKGSSFWATARLDRGNSQLHEMPAEDARSLLVGEFSGPSVLLAGDNPVDREVTAALLEEAGLRVHVAEDGQQCLSRARSGKYALVLMDLQSPVFNGIEAASAIRQLPRGAELPILAMSAGVDEEERAAGLAAGVNDYLLKPVEPTVLYAKLLKWLRPARA